jgi:peptidoglycan LD-endopeptidase LytH
LTLALVAVLGASSCADEPAAAPATTVAVTTVPTTTVPTTTTTVEATTTTTTVTVPAYTFPFTGVGVSYGDDHSGYRATDVFGCGAMVVSPTNGTVVQVRDVDLWDEAVNAPSTRGGKYVAVLGVDGVRYYFAHLDTVLVAEGQAVQPGDPLGPMGDTGDARSTVCHTHMGISWVCPGNEWKVRRGMVWPSPYLDAWRTGEQTSPALEVAGEMAAQPDACAEALAQPDAAMS